MNIIQIVPRIFPAIDGVGDYALNLAHKLRELFAIETHFVVADTDWRGQPEVDGFAITKLSEPSQEALFSTLQRISPINRICPIILQYVGCGYAKRGCPLWLVRGLELYRRFNSDSKLATMFHETYGSGPPYYGADPPWISAFWLAPIQKNIAKRLTNLSDLCFTSRAGFKRQLRNLTLKGNTPISLLPVFSNVGEQSNPPPPTERESILVVFGSRLSRIRTYTQFSAQMEECCRLLQIDFIYDIGSDTGLNLNRIGRRKVVSLGKKTSVEIANLFARSKAGILNYHPEYLAKSGVFAAYCAHGIIPIVAFTPMSETIDSDGLTAGKHYLFVANKNLSINSKLEQVIASNAHDWYQTHNLTMQAQTFAAYLRSKTAIETQF